MRSLGGWLKGFATTMLVGVAGFVSYHVLRFYVGLVWTIVIAALLALLMLVAMAIRIVWTVGRNASRDDTRTG